MLEAALDARSTGTEVELALSVENAGDEPVTLTFRDARRAEFVASVDGEEVWRWSRGRMFAQSLGEETLAPGEERTFDATWDDPAPGTYSIEASLAASDADARAGTTVTVPG